VISADKPYGRFGLVIGVRFEFSGFGFIQQTIAFWELELFCFGLLVNLQAHDFMGIRILWFRLCGDPLSFMKAIPGFHPSGHAEHVQKCSPHF